MGLGTAIASWQGAHFDGSAAGPAGTLWHMGNIDCHKSQLDDCQICVVQGHRLILQVMESSVVSLKNPSSDPNFFRRFPRV